MQILYLSLSKVLGRKFCVHISTCMNPPLGADEVGGLELCHKVKTVYISVLPSKFCGDFFAIS